MNKVGIKLLNPAYMPLQMKGTLLTQIWPFMVARTSPLILTNIDRSQLDIHSETTATLAKIVHIKFWISTAAQYAKKDEQVLLLQIALTVQYMPTVIT